MLHRVRAAEGPGPGPSPHADHLSRVLDIRMTRPVRSRGVGLLRELGIFKPVVQPSYTLTQRRRDHRHRYLGLR
jgi:hypothetical protein